MKKFFMVTPQQPEGSLRPLVYEARDNERLAYGRPTCFPVIPLIAGYAEAGERVKVVTVTYGEPSNCRNNLRRLEGEIEALSNDTGIEIELDSVDVPFDDGVGQLIRTWQLLCERMGDGDELFACVTFGSKPMPIMLMSALNFGYRIRDDVSIECVAYGQMDWSQTPPAAVIYDVTAILRMDEIVRVLADTGAPDPEGTLRRVLGLTVESDG